MKRICDQNKIKNARKIKIKVIVKQRIFVCKVANLKDKE